MSEDRQSIGGELFLSLRTVARTFHVETLVLERAYECGLLGEGVQREAVVMLRAVELDRVATVVRLHVELGVDLETLEWMLGPPPS